MSRVQLSVNVSDFDAAVAFYSRLFGTAPAKLRPGYANFAIDDPPLKLVLNSPGNGPRGTINHLGVEVGLPGDVAEARARLAAEGPAVRPSLAPCAAMPGRTRSGRMTRTGWRGSTTPSWSTSRPHDLPAPRPACYCR
jgi:catechol 2,3-dioxygenase-like lactoylglutathione lyase family enzyme